MRADRLLSMMNHLQARGRATARELAEMLEVSERTIHRDMESLSSSGIPVYAERGSQGGWVLQEGYRSQLTGLTSPEIRALILLQSSSATMDLHLPGDVASALRKLTTALTPAARDEASFTRRHLHIDGAGWREAKEPARFLLLVQQAVWEQRMLRIRYTAAAGGSDEAPERIVAPWGLVAKRQTWYVICATGASEGEDELRTYRVSRIQEAELTDEGFDVPDTFELAEWWGHSTERFKAALPVYPARIAVREDALDRFSRESYATIKTTQTANGGWVELEVDFHTEDSARSLLLGYGASVRALIPVSLARSLVSEAKALLTLYAGPDSPPQDHGQI